MSDPADNSGAPASQPFDVAQFQMEAAAHVETLVRGRQFAEAGEFGRAVFRRISSQPESSPYHASSLETALYVSHAAGELGDEPEVLRWLEFAVTIARDLEGRSQLDNPQLLFLAGAAHHNLAAKYVAMNRPDTGARAETLLQQSLHYVLRQGKQGTAEHAGELAQLALAVEQKGDVAKAGQLLAQAIDIYAAAPDMTPREWNDYIHFLSDLGAFHLRHENPAEAIGPLQRALELHETILASDPPTRANVHSALALACFRSGRWAQSIARSQQAIGLRLGGQIEGRRGVR